MRCGGRRSSRRSRRLRPFGPRGPLRRSSCGGRSVALARRCCAASPSPAATATCLRLRLAARLAFALRPFLLGAGRDHRERHAAAVLVDRRDPHANLVADRDHVVRIADEAGAELADVDQAAVREADVDERAEVDDVQHRAAELHADGRSSNLTTSLRKIGGGRSCAGRGPASRGPRSCRRA